MDDDFNAVTEYEGRDNELHEWKEELKQDFHQWIDELSEIPDVEAPAEEIDLYSYYQELCVVTNEVKRGGRRNQEVLTRFGEGLSGFQKALSDIQDRFATMDSQRTEEDVLNQKKYFLPLVNILERMERLRAKFYSPPGKTFFHKRRNWQEAWTQLKEGYEIIFSHLDHLLKEDGIIRIKTVGQPFDPQSMAAVAVEIDEKHPPDMVIEEISAGFLFKGIVIKMAEVKITKLGNEKRG